VSQALSSDANIASEAVGDSFHSVYHAIEFIAMRK
jgi:hypothetical protein